MIIRETASAKVNLFLHVGERRADGFHPLQSLAVFTAMGDDLRAEAAPKLALSLDGPFSGGLSGENQDDNLVLHAARALAAKGNTTQGAGLTLTKNLPVASGIGGGSADAAAALRALTQLWQPGVDQGVLEEIAAGLGSDIPVCLASVPAFMEGRGEILHPIAAMPRLGLLLVNPGVAVPTKEVFATLKTRSGVTRVLPGNGFTDCADLLRFLETTTNDLEAPSRILQPVIGEVLAALAALPGTLFTRMSGSGATCFAIFPDDDSCARAAARLRAAAPGWWVAATFVPGQGQPDAELTPGQEIGPTDAGL